METQSIVKMAQAQAEQMSLDQAFYRDADVYDIEMDRIFMNSWLYAGHISEIPNVGDWFLYKLDRE